MVVPSCRLVVIQDKREERLPLFVLHVCHDPILCSVLLHLTLPTVIASEETSEAVSVNKSFALGIRLL